MSQVVKRWNAAEGGGCEPAPPGDSGDYVESCDYDTLLEALTLAASKPLAEHCTDEEWAFIRGAIMGAQGEQP